MSAANFKIEKTTEQAWRVVNFGADAHTASIVCWNVFDGNELVYGGVRQGNNAKSGCAEVPRRKDAVAFVAGYNSGVEGRKEARAAAFRYARENGDRELSGHFLIGALRAASEVTA